MTIPDATWLGLLIGLVLLVAGVPIVAHLVSRLDPDPRTFRLVMCSGTLKLIAAPLWIYVIDHFYGGVADAYTYNRVGAEVAAQISQGDFAFHVGKVIGDGATSLITGFIYVLIGSNTLGGFFVFAFISFVSLALFYRAFRVALPEGDSRRYALLVFLFPSLLFWTSAIGKDALISLGLSLAALGGARLFARLRGAFPLLGAGLGLTALVRPHVALMFFVALGLGYPLVRARKATPLTPILKAIQVVLLIAGGLLLAKLTAHFFGLQSLSVGSVQHVLRQTALNTGTAARHQVGQFASSESTSVSLSPAAIPRDFYDVILRPLPFDAHGLTQLASSLENLFLVAILVLSWRRLVGALKSMWRRPYLLSAGLYSLVWIVLFASVGNLGILARERTSLLPVLFVLVAWERPDRGIAMESAPADDGQANLVSARVG